LKDLLFKAEFESWLVLPMP